MALLSAVVLTSAQFEKLRIEKRRLVNEVFYAYASSTAGRQVIDPHLITQALTTWSWYWLCAEAIAIIIPTAAILAFWSQFQWVSGLLTTVLVLMLVMRVFRADCSMYAEAQVREILSDNGRRQRVVAIFNAL
jgi:hypothetical protein